MSIGLPIQQEQQERIWGACFSFLFASRVAKVLADNMASIAVVWLLIQMGGSATSTAVLYTCTLVPQTVLSSIVSPLLKKGHLQTWMFISDTVRAVAVLVLAICALTDSLTLWLLFTLVIFQSATGAFYNPASIALLPKLVAPSSLQQANGVLQASSDVVSLVGLACGGLMITLLSTQVALVVLAGLFLLSALLVLGAKANTTKETVPDAQEVRGRITDSYWKQIREGFAIVKQHKLLYGLNLYALFMNIGLAPWAALSALFVAQELHSDASTLTLLRTSTAVGSMLMGIVLARTKIRRLGALFVLAGIVEGIVFVTVGVSPWVWLIVLGTFLYGMCTTAINVPEVVIIQTTVPQEQQAQVYSVIMTISVGLLPIGYLLAGWFAERFGNAAVILGGGLIILLSGLLVRLFTPLSTYEAQS